LRLPTWEEFLEKERMWQKHIHQQMKEKISGIVKEHPLLDMAFEAYLIFLPPPLGTIAQNIYNNAKGSENDRVNAVLKYFDELKE
jgi:hypothetical protein